MGGVFKVYIQGMQESIVISSSYVMSFKVCRKSLVISSQDISCPQGMSLQWVTSHIFKVRNEFKIVV